MNCKEMRDILFTDYYDNMLDPKARIEADSHLSSCPECSALLAELKSSLSVFKAAKTYNTPPIVWEKVKQKAGREASGWNFHLNWAGAFAMVSILFITLLAGNYFGSSVLQVSAEKAFYSEYSAFEDIQNEHFKPVYESVMVTGGR